MSHVPFENNTCVESLLAFVHPPSLSVPLCPDDLILNCFIGIQFVLYVSLPKCRYYLVSQWQECEM